MDKNYADNPIARKAPATFLVSVVLGAARTPPGGGGPVHRLGLLASRCAAIAAQDATPERERHTLCSGQCSVAALHP